MAGSKEVATFEATKFPVLTGEGDGAEITEIIEENFGEDGISAFDLDRIKIPAGGGTTWEIPDLDGERAEKVLEGIIVAWEKPRVYWEKSLDDSDEAGPPDCASDDGKLGNGVYGVGSEAHPSGECATCPMNQFGAAGDGSKGKPCKEQRLLFMLLEGGLMPVTVNLPPTSIGPFRKYMMRLASRSVPYYAVTTKIALKKVDGGGAIKYSVAEPALGVRLPPEIATAAKEYGQAFKKSQQRAGGLAAVAADEYARGAADLSAEQGDPHA